MNNKKNSLFFSEGHCITFATDPGVAAVDGHMRQERLLRGGAGNRRVRPSLGEETHRHSNHYGNYLDLTIDLLTPLQHSHSLIMYLTLVMESRAVHRAS